MAQPFAEVFARQGPAEAPKAHEELSRALDEACRNLAGTLAACPPALRQDLLAVITPRVRTLLQEMGAPAPKTPTSPEGAGTCGAPPDGSGPGRATTISPEKGGRVKDVASARRGTAHPGRATKRARAG